MQSLRRRSISLAEDMRHELISLRNQTITAISAENSVSNQDGLGVPWRKLSASMAARVLRTEDENMAGRRVSEPIADLLDPSTWASGREERIDSTRRRSSRFADENISCDIEAQHEHSDSD